jgi:hypothetical protein
LTFKIFFFFSSDGIVTKVGEFMMDFKEEPDMSVFTPSIESMKRPAQLMS